MLYFVATPIGNLKDITLRALDILNEVDVIACEDTRKTLKLLNHYNIKKKLLSYHKNNEENSSEGIIKLLQEGKNIAVVSDAGMPVISDPGETLVKKLIENNLEYTVVPGANAGLCALILSGLDSSRFTFVGFLPDNKKECRAILEDIKFCSTTLVFYVAPHDVVRVSKILFESLGKRKAVFVNEITKMFEKKNEIILGDEINFEPKGEYVLVVEGCIKLENSEVDSLTGLSIEEHLKYYISLGVEKAQAIKKVAKERGINKNEVYQVAIKL